MPGAECGSCADDDSTANSNVCAGSGFDAWIELCLPAADSGDSWGVGADQVRAVFRTSSAASGANFSRTHAELSATTGSSEGIRSCDDPAVVPVDSVQGPYVRAYDARDQAGSVHRKAGVDEVILECRGLMKVHGFMVSG